MLPSALGFGGEDEYTVAVSRTPAHAPIADAAVREAGAFDAEASRLRRRGRRRRRRSTGRAGSARRRSPTTSSSSILQAANAQVRSAEALRERRARRRARRARALSPPPLAVTTVEPVDEAAEERGGFAFFAVLLLYGQLIGMGYFVAMGVVEEKSSRVVELLLSTLRPRHLLAGKIIGLGLLGLGQLLLLAVVGLARRAAPRRRARRRRRPADRPPALALVWFVVGYAFYAAAFACAASLVSRQEDLQSVLTPLTMRADGRLLRLVRGASSDPDGTLATVVVVHPAGGADDDAAADRARGGERARDRRRARGHARAPRRC